MEFKLPFIVNSSPDAGALNRSQDGSAFEILLEEPLLIPKDAKNVYLTVQESQVWWNTFNIIENENDQLRVTYDDGVIFTDTTITIEPGLYDLSHLNAAVQRELNNAGLPENLLTLIPDTASGKSVIQFLTDGIQVDMTIARSFRELLGFDSRLVPLAPTTNEDGQYEISDNIADFNPLEYFLIHSDLVARGIRTNSVYSQVIAQIPIKSAPGSLLVSEPFNPPEIPCNELIGAKRKKIGFFLTDDKNNLINTNGEDWSCRFIIHYTLPIDRPLERVTK